MFFYSTIYSGHTRCFTNQLKLKAMPFLAYRWSVYLMIISYTFSLLRNRTKKIDWLNHPLPFSIMRKLHEVISVYQSSFSDNEDEDEMDTGFRYHGYPCCDYEYLQLEWRSEEDSQTRADDEVFVFNCLQVWLLFFSIRPAIAKKNCRVFCLYLILLRIIRRNYRLWSMTGSLY